MLIKKIQLRCNTIWQSNVVGVGDSGELRFAHGQAYIPRSTLAHIPSKVCHLDSWVCEMVKVCG
jgi:hypothetical protein